MQCCINKQLKNVKRVAQFKKHNNIFKKIVFCKKRDFFFVFLSYSYFIKRCYNIEFVEIFNKKQFNQRVFYQRKRVSVFNNKIIERFIIYAYSQFFV